jgi:hypothetical protein
MVSRSRNLYLSLAGGPLPWEAFLCGEAESYLSESPQPGAATNKPHWSKIKHALSSDRVLLESALRGAQQGLDASHNLRLTAIGGLWEGVLSLRNDYSGVVFFYNILLPSEYDSAYRKGESLAASIRDLDDEKNMAAIKRVDSIERERPYLGETLWLRFFIYRAFLGRLAVLTIKGKRTGHFEDWRKDGGIHQIISTVLPSNLVGDLLNGDGKQGAMGY